MTHAVPFPYADAPPDAFTLADRQLCQRVSATFYDGRPYARADVRCAKWADLAARIQRALVGEFTAFTRADCGLVQALHMEVLRHRLDDGARERSRALSRLGVLVVQASRGHLAQLRGGASR